MSESALVAAVFQPNIHVKSQPRKFVAHDHAMGENILKIFEVGDTCQCFFL
jgi:hypothetical protein